MVPADNQNEATSAVIRIARPEDAPAAAELLALLGYPSQVTDVERRISGSAISEGTVVFVADSANHVVGLLSFHCIPLFHADEPLGRITSLVVDPDYRQRGIGRLLVAAAEEFAWRCRCIRVEVTSGDH